MSKSLANTKIVDVLDVDPSTIHANPWNPNKQTERVQDATRESIATFGFIDPVTVRRHPEIEGHYQIIDGEHRWRAATDLGLEVVTAAVIDVDDAAAKKLTIILNETRGEADKVDLAGLLASLKDEYGDNLGVGLPYAEDELDGLLKLAEFDFDNFENNKDAVGGDAGEPDPDDSWRTIHVRVPEAVVAVFEQARARIEENFDDGAHEHEPVRNGQTLEVLLAEYLAGP